jgi:regulator of protease activity HflC (stomatin/prohibitin superfamily)
MGTIVLAILATMLFVVLMIALSAIKILPEYERGVVFRLGRLVAARGSRPQP